MNQTARQARAMSRRVPPDRVLYIELTEFIMNTDPGVRQSERMDDMPNRAAGDARGAPLQLIAASLRRERRRPRPPPTHVAPRAGVAQSPPAPLQTANPQPPPD